MKTHLPVALRKALLAALVAVTFTAYDKALAAEVTVDSITAAGTSSEVSGEDMLKITSVSTSADRLFLTSEQGNISMSEVSVSGGDRILESLAITTGGGSVIMEKFLVGDQPSLTFLNAQIELGGSGNLIIGPSVMSDAAGSPGLLLFRGTDNTAVKVGGTLTFNSSVTIAPGMDNAPAGVNRDAGLVTLEVGGDIVFNGASASIQGGSEHATNVTAKGDIIFTNTEGTNIADDANVVSRQGKVSIDATQSSADISGSIKAEQGNVEVKATAINVAAEDGKNAQIESAGEIRFNASVVNNIQDAKYEAREIGLSAELTYVVDTEFKGTESVGIQGETITSLTRTTVYDSGSVVIGQTDADTDGTGTTTVSSSSISATADVNIGGATVAVSDNKGIETTAGNVVVSASAADDADTPALRVQGGTISASNDVSLQAEAGSAEVSDVQITGEAVAIAGKSATTVTKVGAESSSIAVGDAASETLVESASNLKASGDVGITGSGAIVSGSTVTSEQGEASFTAVNSGSLSASDVTGASVALNGGDIEVKDGTAVTATGENISGNVKSLTVGTAGETVTEDTLTAGKDVDLTVSESFTLHGAALVKAERGSVSVDGGEASLNTVTGTNTLVEASEDIEFSGACNLVTAGAELKSAADITLTSDSTVVDHGNLVDSALLTATAGDIALTASRTNRVANGAEVTALDGAVTLQGNVANIVDGTDTAVKAGGGALTLGNEHTQANLVSSAGLTAAGDEGQIYLTAHSNVISTQAELQAAGGIKVTSTGTTPNAGNVIAASELQASGGDAELTATNINQVEAAQVSADAGAVRITGASNILRNSSEIQAVNGVDINSTATDASAGNVVAASTVQSAAGDVSLMAANINMVTESRVDADVGAVSMSGTSNIVTADSSVVAGNGIAMTASGQGDTSGNQLAGSTLRAEGGDVDIQAQKHNHVTNGASIAAEAGSVSFIAATNTLDKAAQVEASGDVSLTGDNAISSESAQDARTAITSLQGSITLNGGNDIKYATIEARGAEGDVAIITGEGKSTRVEDSTITGETVAISGASRSNLAELTGQGLLIKSLGEDSGTGITLSNVSVANTGKEKQNISAADGGITVRNRVDVENGALTIAAADAAIGFENAGSVLNMKKDSVLTGRLAGDGAINKSGGDALLLAGDSTQFAGTIYANGANGGPEGSVADAANAGSWVQVAGPGVGTDAKMVLKNTDLVLSSAETQIGTLDTTQDAVANNAATGSTLGADGSYTADDNARADFTAIGSVLEVNKGAADDVVHATDMNLSDATLLKLDVAVDADGNASSDRIAAAGSVHVAAQSGLNSTSTATAPSTARVYAELDEAAAASAAEGARSTIMTGTMAVPINEDVLYEVKKSANGTYQRTLQDRNMHLENKGDRVDLVFSKNYRSAAKTAPMQKVADAIRQYSDAFHHSEGWLAASDSRMAKLVDAFDYTRSEGAAQRGLQSVMGAGTVLPQLMLFDSSRHHLNQLRKQMEMPVCPRTWKGAPSRKSNAWLTYTGAYDSLNGDANLGDYTRSAHGAMLGVDTALTCKLRAGLSLGYETGSGEADSAKVDADTIFVDAYASAYTGHIKHRASIGLALTSFDSRRAVEVEAGYHSFHGSARSDTDALTLNFGYEISSDYKLSERSWLTRFAALNLAWHNLDDMKESGLGEIGLVSEYDSEWQAGVAVGVAYNCEFAAVKYEAPAVFSAHAAVHAELLADKASVKNRFSGAEGAWVSRSMDREPFYIELGAGVAVPFSPAWTATAGAAVEVGADRSSFSGNVGVRYSF